MGEREISDKNKYEQTNSIGHYDPTNMAKVISDNLALSKLNIYFVQIAHASNIIRLVSK